MKRKKSYKSKVKKLEQSENKFGEQTAEKDERSANLIAQIKEAAEGLFYISETDAEIVPFVGTTADKVDRAEILQQTESKADAPVEEKSFSDFFRRLTEIEDWFGDEEKETAQKFARLKEVLENNVRDLKVFKIGKIELEIYVVGLDAENTLLGIKTKAVET